MSNDLLIITFPGEKAARKGGERLLELEKANLLAIQDAVVATKDGHGGLRLSPLPDPNRFWDIRAAASGNLSPANAGALTEFGASEKFIRDISEVLPAGSAAIFVLVWKAAPEKVAEGLKDLHGKVLSTSFDKSAAEVIRFCVAGSEPAGGAYRCGS